MAASLKINDSLTAYYWKKSDPASTNGWVNKNGKKTELPDSFFTLNYEGKLKEFRFVLCLEELSELVDFTQGCLRANQVNAEAVIHEARVTFSGSDRCFYIEVDGDTIVLGCSEMTEFIMFYDTHKISTAPVTPSEKLSELLKIQAEIRRHYMAIGLLQKKNKALQAEIAAMIEDPTDLAVLGGFLIKRKQRNSKQIVVTLLDALRLD